MRFLLIVVILALVLAIVGFTATNIETLTAVTLWQTTYHDVPLWSVVFLSALAGVVSVGIIGVVDGALVRLRNRQMSRELQRLETELNFLRTQPPTKPFLRVRAAYSATARRPSEPAMCDHRKREQWQGPPVDRDA